MRSQNLAIVLSNWRSPFDHLGCARIWCLYNLSDGLVQKIKAMSYSSLERVGLLIAEILDEGGVSDNRTRYIDAG